jgi:hypothetical protein
MGASSGSPGKAGPTRRHTRSRRPRLGKTTAAECATTKGPASGGEPIVETLVHLGGMRSMIQIGLLAALLAAVA